MWRYCGRHTASVVVGDVKPHSVPKLKAKKELDWVDPIGASRGHQRGISSYRPSSEERPKNNILEVTGAAASSLVSGWCCGASEPSSWRPLSVSQDEARIQSGAGAGPTAATS